MSSRAFLIFRAGVSSVEVPLKSFDRFTPAPILLDFRHSSKTVTSACVQYVVLPFSITLSGKHFFAFSVMTFGRVPSCPATSFVVYSFFAVNSFILPPMQKKASWLRITQIVESAFRLMRKPQGSEPKQFRESDGMTPSTVSMLIKTIVSIAKNVNMFS